MSINFDEIMDGVDEAVFENKTTPRKVKPVATGVRKTHYTKCTLVRDTGHCVDGVFHSKRGGKRGCWACRGKGWLSNNIDTPRNARREDVNARGLATHHYLDSAMYPNLDYS